MKINKIGIRNFRGFESYSTEFHPNTTVIIGDNMDGKTSLLQALQVGLGAYFESLKTLPTTKLYRKRFVESDRYLRYDAGLKDYVENEDSPRIDVEADFFRTQVDGNEVKLVPETIHWYREMTKSGHTNFNQECAREMMDVVRQMEVGRFENHEERVFPLFLAFATNRIDKQFRATTKSKERSQRLEKAYRTALSDSVDFVGAMEWLGHYDKSLKDGKEFAGTREAFYNALMTAIPFLSEIDFDNNELEAVVTLPGCNPVRHHYSYMSDGFKAVINIVAEMAYKAVLLNGFLGEEAVRKTPGVVMIDEIDLYLHPKWQRRILADLNHAFPMIQFIVTTHSPFIVQSIGENQLINFDGDEEMGGVPNRESLEDIVSERMGMEQELRSQQFNRMQEVAAQYFDKLDKGENDEELGRELDRIEAEFSDDPAYVALIKNQYLIR